MHDGLSLVIDFVGDIAVPPVVKTPEGGIVPIFKPL
jgi:hypothetical protein